VGHGHESGASLKFYEGSRDMSKGARNLDHAALGALFIVTIGLW
jgi:hypothetical protein